MGLGGKVAIIGTGVIKLGENFHQSLTDMVGGSSPAATRSAPQASEWSPTSTTSC
jgi:hypothetical protein